MRILLAAASLLATVALAGCSNSDAGGPQPPVVSSTDHLFTPAQLTVPAGTEVKWTNDGEAPHTVTVEDPAGGPYLMDKNIEPGEATTYTFATPGDYHVVCIYHAGMVMDVTVTG